MKILLPLLFILFSVNLKAELDLAKVKSAFISKFTKFIDIPDQGSPNFTIGVHEDPVVLDYLQAMLKEKKVKNKDVVVKNIKEAETFDIIVTGTQSIEGLQELKKTHANSSTLWISHAPGLASNGSHINFLIKLGKLKFEINKTLAEKNKIKINARLLKLAIITE